MDFIHNCDDMKLFYTLLPCVCLDLFATWL